MAFVHTREHPWQLLPSPHLLLITNVTTIQISPTLSTNKITAMELLPLTHHALTTNATTRPLRLLRAALKEHTLHTHDASSSHDITSRSINSHRHSSPRFHWNPSHLTPHLPPPFAPPASSLHLNTLSLPTSPPLTYTLISRRPTHCAGTRYTARGASPSGHVANYIETESIATLGNHTLWSHVQTRGSVPLSWSSPASLRRCVRERGNS